MWDDAESTYLQLRNGAVFGIESEGGLEGLSGGGVACVTLPCIEEV